jgi:exportin-1
MISNEQIKLNSIHTQYHQRIRQLVLELLEVFVLSNDRLDLQDQTTMSGLIRFILVDYKNCTQPEQREPSVLSLLTSLFEKMQEPIWPDLLQETIDIEFATTLPMITSNFVDYPDIRHEFYRLLRVLNRRCFIGKRFDMLECFIRS